MKAPYCLECGKQGCYFAYLSILILIGIAIGLVIVGCKNKAEAFEPNVPYFTEPGVISEPNEQEEHWIDVSEITIPKEYRKAMGLGDIIDFIPTWPDYIELEKNLVIDANDYIFAHGSYDGYHVTTGVTNTLVIPEGTKIYFKEDE